MATMLHDRLRSLVGQTFDYLGEPWVLIEVLSDDDSVVLDRAHQLMQQAVQANAYGVPTRRANQTLTLPISDATGDSYSQDLMLLLEGRRAPGHHA
jgi:hypothetical protein